MSYCVTCDSCGKDFASENVTIVSDSMVACYNCADQIHAEMAEASQMSEGDINEYLRDAHPTAGHHANEDDFRMDDEFNDLLEYDENPAVDWDYRRGEW